MDGMRGGFGAVAESDAYDVDEEELAQDSPPAVIGTDERRMQVRAYKHWASLLTGANNYPAIDDLNTEVLPEFAPYSVLLDITQGLENPSIAFLGAELAGECGEDGQQFRSLADVHSRSLLSRITDHYMQILANQAPIGFEAEFVNQRGATIMYRGILLPFSSDDETIDFIYGVINWKELADEASADELLLEIDQALGPKPARAPLIDAMAPLTDWADGPGAVPANDLEEDSDDNDHADFASQLRDRLLHTSPAEIDEDDDDEEPVAKSLYGSLLKTPISFAKKPFAHGPDNAELGDWAEPTSIDLSEIDEEAMELGDWLEAARETAAAAHSSEDRTREALYRAIGRAYDFSLAAQDAAEELAELLADAGVKAQARAPMTPIVKLVFGSDYDKTRLTEFAAALSCGHRLHLARGSLGDYLAKADGGLKGVVTAERQLRKEQAGKPDRKASSSEAIAGKLRRLPPQPLAEIASTGSEFAIVLIRRSDDGQVEILGEVPDDAVLVERAARRLIG